MARSRRDFRPSVDIWPGFVDALSTLLLVFIFLLVVFVLGQFFLNQLLQGQDTRLNTLERAISELTAELDMELATSAELRQSVTQLSSDLQAAIADRDDSAALLADTEAERDEFRDRAFTLEDQQAALDPDPEQPARSRRSGSRTSRPSSSRRRICATACDRSWSRPSRRSQPTGRRSSCSWRSWSSCGATSRR